MTNCVWLDLRTTLKNRIKEAERVAILGIGSDLRGDDAAGILVAGKLDGLSEKNKNRVIKVFLGGTAPENLTSEIKRFKPECLIIIDSAEMGKSAGSIAVLEPKDVGGISFSTHNLPLSVMIEYLKASIDTEIIVIGIQPKRLAFGSLVSDEVKDAVKKISGAIKEALAG